MCSTDSTSPSTPEPWEAELVLLAPDRCTPYRGSFRGVRPQLVAVIREVRPEVVVTFGPDGITGHADHVATWRLATRAWLAAGVGDLRYATHTVGWLDEWHDVNEALGIWMTERPVGEDESSVVLRVDLDALDLDRKRSVLGEHASQTTGIASFLGEDVYRRWIRTETFRRPTPADLAAALAPASRPLAEVGS